MNIMVYSNLEESKINESMRGYLEDFSLYDSNHWISSKVGEDFVSISYWPSFRRQENIGKTGFNIQMIGDVCFILSFSIENDKRKMGNGTNLYRIIESFFMEEFNCGKYRLTPSGQAKEINFWEKMGFYTINKVEVEKVLSS